MEQKVRELEGGGRSSSVERIIKRNEELEAEVERLRAQVALAQVGHQSSSAASPTHASPDGLLIPVTSLEWLPEQDQGQWNGISSLNPSMSSNDGQDAPYTLDDQIFPPPETHRKYEETDDQQQYAPTATPIWNDPMSMGDGYGKAAWAPFHPALSQPSRFADLQTAGFSEVCAFSKQVSPYVLKYNRL